MFHKRMFNMNIKVLFNFNYYLTCEMVSSHAVRKITSKKDWVTRAPSVFVLLALYQRTVQYSTNFGRQPANGS